MRRSIEGLSGRMALLLPGAVTGGKRLDGEIVYEITERWPLWREEWSARASGHNRPSSESCGAGVM
jgi:hypothetical protein